MQCFKKTKVYNCSLYTVTKFCDSPIMIFGHDLLILLHSKLKKRKKPYL